MHEQRLSLARFFKNTKPTKMKTLAEIFYDAIQADETLKEAVKYTTPQGTTAYAIINTCFEVPPGELDNTPLPNIIITNDGFQNNTSTKDCVWESDEDAVQASVDVAASSPQEVDSLVAKVRKAIDTYITTMYTNGSAIPELQPGSPSSQGIEWDWMKPCYYQKITYQCITEKYTEDEQENN